LPLDKANIADVVEPVQVAYPRLLARYFQDVADPVRFDRGFVPIGGEPDPDSPSGNAADHVERGRSRLSREPAFQKSAPRLPC
jgi:hypothetical protein